MKPHPSNFLPACPVCSNAFNVVRPAWHYASHTSTRTGVDHYGLVACKHVAEVVNVSKIRGDPEEWALVEDEWARRQKEMMADVEARYHPAIVAKLKAAIDGRRDPGGQTFTPDPPAQHEQHEPTKEK